MTRRKTVTISLRKQVYVAALGKLITNNRSIYSVIVFPNVTL